MKEIVIKDIEIASNIVRGWLLEEYPESQTEKGIKEFSGRIKAAIFLIIIGTEQAEEIFKYLREDEIETLTFEITRVDIISHETKTNIMKEYEMLSQLKEFNSIGGVDYARTILEKSFGEQKAIDILNRLTSSLQVKPFDFIRKCEPRQLLQILYQEHPQTIAVVLSFLEPNKSSVILEKLPSEIQADVMRRIACLNYIMPETIREVERVLEKKLSMIDLDYSVYRVGGIESTVEILNLVDRATEKQILESLEDEDPELAEEIKKRMFVFEDIIMLDDRAVQKIMREVDSQELAKALFGVDREVQEKVFKNMSMRAAAMLKEDMEYMGPIRTKDVEEAQQKIVSITRHLEDMGEIIIVRSGEDELIVPPDFNTKAKSFSDIILNSDDDIIKKLVKDNKELLILALSVTNEQAINKITNQIELFSRIKFKNKLKKMKKNINDIPSIIDAQHEIIYNLRQLEEGEDNE